MLIASSKSQCVKGASHQPVITSGCLIISHTCLPCLPHEKTLLFWRDLVVIGREVSWEKWETSELERWERCMSGVSWQGGKGGRIVRWHGQRGGNVVRWQFAKGGRVVRWQGEKVGRVVRWQGGRFLVIFRDGECRVRSRFHLFAYDANQQNEGAGCVQDICVWSQGWKDSQWI